MNACFSNTVCAVHFLTRELSTISSTEGWADEGDASCLEVSVNQKATINHNEITRLKLL